MYSPIDNTDAASMHIGLEPYETRYSVDSQKDEPLGEEDLPLKEAIKLYPKVILHCLGMTTVILLWGYELVIVGAVTAVPAFQRDFGQQFREGDVNEYIIPALWIALWTACGPLGSAFGAMTGGWVQDRIGRKRCLGVGSIFSIIAVAIIFISNQPAGVDAKRAVFLAGKILQGFSVGMIKIQALTYVSENIPTCLRGSAMALFPAFTLLGQLIGAVVMFAISKAESSTSYMAAFASQWPLSLICLLLAFITPESPAYLVRKNMMDKALKSLERLFEPKVDSKKLLERLRVSIEEEERNSPNVSYKDCFSAMNRRRTGIVIFASVLSNMFGLPLLSSASYFLQQVGMEPSTSLLFLIIGIVAGMLSNSTSVWVLSRFGRRIISLITLGIAMLLWTGMGISGFWNGTTVTTWWTAITCIVTVVVTGLGVWPASYAIKGETSSLRLRAKTQGLGGLADYVSTVAISIVLPYLYNPDASNLGAKTGFVFSGLCAIALVTMYFVVPEMKGRSIMELDRMFELKLSARKFESWKPSVVDYDDTAYHHGDVEIGA